VPSDSATYTSAQIQAALKASFGYEVTIGCASGALDEIWYSFDVRGSVITGTFVPTAPGQCVLALSLEPTSLSLENYRV
jgi:ribonuclease T2